MNGMRIKIKDFLRVLKQRSWFVKPLRAVKIRDLSKQSPICRRLFLASAYPQELPAISLDMLAKHQKRHARSPTLSSRCYNMVKNEDNLPGGGRSKQITKK